jgi:hypothetical protein
MQHNAAVVPAVGAAVLALQALHVQQMQHLL